MNKDILMNRTEFLIKCKSAAEAHNDAELFNIVSGVEKQYVNALRELGEIEPTNNDLLTLCEAFNVMCKALQCNIFTMEQVDSTMNSVFALLNASYAGHYLFGKVCIPVMEQMMKSGNQE